MANIEGTFIWYELLTPDIEAATAFYCNVVGFSAEKMLVEGIAYKILSSCGRPTAAVLDVSAVDGVSRPLSGWIGYVAVKDVDETAARMTELGVVVRQAPYDVAGIGRFAIVDDPQGAPIGLFAPLPGDAERVQADPAAAGHVAWHELYTSDPHAALSFYDDALKWKGGQAFDMGPAGPYLVFSSGGWPTGGIMRRPPGMPGPLWSPFFHVGDIDAASRRVLADGGKVFDGPREVPDGGFTLKCLDNQGAVFALVGQKPS
ncbi:VOC family protein [Rhizobium leguminosarum]|uniref:VOC family protein n=1 Tax=Rhizobium leguminosarum TaxID=384 RepID=UPI001030FDEF|nr:VOC family protein [Rhizobium leguminosarum]TAU90813.1 VOC family protein [Rhizobium leguminosarum]TAV55472.1 VOC family protein [Rhizobium leguminosarum]TAX57713.1 VOC family protein [Rhizobium leguminosarum]TAX62054.1 VOC family protein [Rhizobium leguminosarum]TAY03583.1 VOC family protein [Rhizobium leguminosarum]